MNVDKRTFVIVVIILAIALPIIILIFHKAFFPIILSVKNTFTLAALKSSSTGMPATIIKFFTGSK
jgi:hypothetical protein